MSLAPDGRKPGCQPFPGLAMRYPTPRTLKIQVGRRAASGRQRRMQADLGYGLEGRKERTLWMPLLAAEASGSNRTLRTGLKPTSGANAEFELGPGRCQSVGGGYSEGALRLQGRMRR